MGRDFNALLEERFQLRGHFAVVDVSVEKATSDELRAPWTGKLRVPAGSGGREAGEGRLECRWDATEGHLGGCRMRANRACGLLPDTLACL
jgi:hypothetical protein